MIQTNCNGVITFTSRPLTQPFSELFTVSVGAVAKRKPTTFEPNGTLFVSSKGHEGKFAMYEIDHQEWIRKPNGLITNLFCHCKTRSDKPFFATAEKMPWDGAVLGLFPTEECKKRFTDRKSVLEYLNSQPWDELGFLCGGRYQFSLRSLQNIWLV